MRSFVRLDTLLSLSAALVATLVAAPALADFGNKGDVAFSGERLMGAYFFNEGGDSTVVGIGATPPFHLYTTARLGIDGFVINNLSIGGSFAFLSNSPDRGPSQSGALLTARIGYAIPFSDKFGFWPRGGFSFYSYGNGDAHDDGFAVTLEGMFYASPVQHFAFTFGPVMDLEFAGKEPLARNIGLISVGVTGWL
jgi:hypothetical protein